MLHFEIDQLKDLQIVHWNAELPRLQHRKAKQTLNKQSLNNVNND